MNKHLRGVLGIEKAMKKANRAKECKSYLNYCLKEGAIDEVQAQELVDNEDWDAIEEMMALADYHADLARKDE